MNGAGEQKRKYGIIVFILIACILGIAAFIAAGATGPLGMEERFASISGQNSPGVMDHEGAEAGFSIEGHPWLYAVFLLILIIACIILYRKTRI